MTKSNELLQKRQFYIIYNNLQLFFFFNLIAYFTISYLINVLDPHPTTLKKKKKKKKKTREAVLFLIL